MNKEEFLQALRRDLSGDVPDSIVEENVRYYREYITDEVRKGRTEEEVIEEIGDPRLIAKNIEDTTDLPEEDAAQDFGGGYYESGAETGNAYGEDGYSRQRQNSKGSFHVFDLSKWYVKLGLILVVFVVLYAVFAILGGLFTLLAPFLGPILIIWLLICLFRGPRRRW